jgi:hypothetical protein
MGNDAGGGRFKLRIDLGRLDLNQRLPFCDLVALADEPLGKRPIFHVHAPLGEQHVCGHGGPSV